MTQKDIISQGDNARYYIKIKRDDFHMTRDSWVVNLRWGLPDESLTIEKSDMQKDSSGRWSFQFNTSRMLGKVEAECVYQIPDIDCPDDFRQEVDSQVICLVTTSTFTHIMKCKKKCSDVHYVSYERADI